MEIHLEGNDYFVSRTVIGSDGWSIVILTSANRIWTYKLIGVLATVIVCVLIFVFSGILYLANRSLESVRQSEESKHLLLQAAGEGIFGVDTKGQTTFVNPAALRMLGFSEEEMLGQGAHALIHHSHKDGSNYRVEECPMYGSYTRATENRAVEEVLWRKDGSSFPVEYFSTPIIRDGRVTGAVVVFKDITERKQTEEALKKSEERYRVIIEQMEDGYFETDFSGNFTFVNNAECRNLGYAMEEMIGMNNRQYVEEKNLEELNKIFVQVYKTGIPVKAYALELNKKDGAKAYNEISATLMRNAEGKPIGFRGISRDITERKRSEEALRQSEESKRLLLQAVGEGIFGVNTIGQMTFVNPAALRILGFSEEEMLGQSVHDLIHHSHEDGSNYRVEDCPMYGSYTKATKNNVKNEVLWRKDGSYFPVEYASTPVVDQSQVMGAVVIFSDITQRKWAEEALRNSEGQLRALVSTIPDIIWLKDKDGVYLSCNSMFERFFGARETDIVGKTDYDFVNRELADSFRGHDCEAMSLGKPVIKEDWITFADDGHRAFMEAIKTPMYDARGMLIGVLGIGRDITERKQAEEKIRQMAYHDSLTGLPNRKLFSDRLGIALVQAQRNRMEVGVAMLDLDNFKDVNDTLGHEGGDLLLKAAAERLSATLRKGDTVARVGGDEFVLIFPDQKGIEDVSRVAQKIVDGFRKPFLIDTHSLIVTTSIGLAVYPDDGIDEVGLLKNADSAMYQAKQEGRNRYKIYSEA